jgi:2-iminobutanoate/2-iminopropanoate deaminase
LEILISYSFQAFRRQKNDNDEIITSDIAEQTELVFGEIERVLEQAGASLDDVVKAVIYLTDMNDFSVVSPIRDKYFKKSVPVSTMIEVNGMTRKGAKIEIEVTAIKKK